MGDKAQLIICAARDAFLEKGYDGVSMDEVASRAGVAKQTVYTRDASTDALRVGEEPPGQDDFGDLGGRIAPDTRSAPPNRARTARPLKSVPLPHRARRL